MKQQVNGDSSEHGSPQNKDRSSRIFYGWWIVAASTLSGTIQSVVFSIGGATLFLPAAREFNTTRTAIAGAFAFSRLEGGVTGPLEGYLIHWFGPRRYMVVGWVILGIGVAGIGLSQSIVQFYIAFLVATLGQSMVGFLPMVTVLINWFSRKRGRAIAIYQLGTSFAALLVPLWAWSVLNIGWRETTIGGGIAVILIGIPLALIMRPHPEPYGYYPDGDLREDSSQNGNIGSDGVALPQESISQALKSRNFWVLGTAHLMSLWGWGALRVHAIPALVDIGLHEQTAANIFALSLIISGAGRLLGGFLADLVGTRRMLMAAYLLQAMSMIVIAYASSLPHALVFAVIFGVSWGARGTLMTLLRGEVFGRKNFSRLAGLMDPVSAGGVIISPVFSGFAYDTFGSYRYAFLIIALLSASGILLLQGLQPPSTMDRNSPIKQASKTNTVDD